MEKEGSSLSPEDSEIRRAIWEGAIPIVFSIAQDEVTSLQPPFPYYLHVSRSTYFPMVTAPVKDHFLPSTAVVVDEMWLEYKDIPLKWHYPVGVLFDLFANPQELPWPITVHFQGFPTQQLLRCPNEAFVKSHYMNVLKEANHIKHGDTTMINQLSREDQNSLWEGIINDEYNTFWNVNNTLLRDAKLLKRLPIRIMRKNKPVLMEPVIPTDGTTKDKTLADVLHQVLPDQFPENLDTLVAGEGNFDTRQLPKIVVQGIQPPLNTPITWLVQHCSHPDNFLYILVK